MTLPVARRSCEVCGPRFPKDCWSWKSTRRSSRRVAEISSKQLARQIRERVGRRVAKRRSPFMGPLPVGRRAELRHWRRGCGTIDSCGFSGMAELTLAQFAELTLRLERGELRPDVLRAVGLTEQQWLEQQMVWLERMAAQLERQRSQLFDRYLAVRASAAQELGSAQQTSGTSVRPRIEGGAMSANRSDQKELPTAPHAGFIKVDPPALYTPPAAGVPRAASSEAAAPVAPPTHLSEAYAPPPLVASAFVPRPAGAPPPEPVSPPAAPPIVAPPAFVAQPSAVAPPALVTSPAAVAPPAFVSPPAAVAPPAPVAPPAFVASPAATPAMFVPAAAVAPPAVVAPPAFVSPPSPPPQPGFEAPPAFVSPVAAAAPAAPTAAAARPAFASRTGFGTVVRRAHSPAPTVAFTPQAPRSDPPFSAPAAPPIPGPSALPPRAPVVQAPPIVEQPKNYEPTVAFFVSQPTAPVAPTPPPPSPTATNEPKLALTQLALLVADLNALHDRSAMTLSESGLDANQWQREWAAWQKRFSEQPEERARYEPLVQYYTALRKPHGGQ